MGSRILILSFYYQPDLCAGSFRAKSLVDALKGKVDCSTTIDVVTTLPNRYSTFSDEALEFEKDGNVCIYRAKLPNHQSGMLDQSKAFLSYARYVYKMVRNNQYDLIIATSSRLMTAFYGAVLARTKGAPLYLDIRDIFVDTIKDVLSPIAATVFKPIFSLVERFAMGSAGKINLVSQGFKDYFDKRYPLLDKAYYTNGIDPDFCCGEVCAATKKENRSKKRVVYAGNIGEGQGLHSIIPELAETMQDEIEFIIVGDGGRRKLLELELDKRQVANVRLMLPVSRSKLVEIYKDADVLFLHLNAYDAFEKVLPSKIFEYGALGKPVWAGVAGYSSKFICNELTNATVFPPCNVEKAKDAYYQLRIQDEPRESFVKKYLRENIMEQMAIDILSLSDKGRL